MAAPKPFPSTVLTWWMKDEGIEKCLGELLPVRLFLMLAYSNIDDQKTAYSQLECLVDARKINTWPWSLFLPDAEGLI